jgi:hypothetical protein
VPSALGTTAHYGSICAPDDDPASDRAEQIDGS